MLVPPTVEASPRTVSFTAPCPECGADTAWSQAISERALPEQFAIACTCTTPPRGPSHVVTP